MVDASVLQQLRDIHVPETVSPWPFALGWWIIMLVVVSIVCLLKHTLKYYDNFLIKRQFIKEINATEKAFKQDRRSNYALQKIAKILKKAALHYYPRQMVAGLHGDEWLKFLQATSSNLNITDCGKLFKTALYQEYYKDDIEQGFNLSRQWIKQQRPK